MTPRPARARRGRVPRAACAALATLTLLVGAGCSDDEPDELTSETEVPESSETITLRRGVPHWLDENRERSLAIMNFQTDPIKVDVGYLDDGENEVHTLGIDDTIDADGTTWRIVRITPGDDGSVELAEVD